MDTLAFLFTCVVPTTIIPQQFWLFFKVLWQVMDFPHGSDLTKEGKMWKCHYSCCHTQQEVLTEGA